MRKIDCEALKERALEKAKEVEGEDCYILSIGENDEFILITMSNEELDCFDDGFSFPIYAANKRTGEEAYNYLAGFTEDYPGFEDLNVSELEFQSFERKYRAAGELIKPKEAYNRLKKYYPGFEIASITDFGEYYIAKKELPLGDDGKEAYKINKVTGEITESSFQELINKMKMYEKLDPPEYHF